MERTAQPRKIRAGEVASAIGVSYKALHDWVSKYGDRGVAPTAQQTGTMLVFNWGDIAALALTRYLVDVGMPAYGAFSVSMRVVRSRYPGLFDENDPHWSPADDKHRPTLDFFLSRESASWGFGRLDGTETSEEHFAIRDRHLKDKLFPTRVIITLFVSVIILEAFKALFESGHIPPRMDDDAQQKAQAPAPAEPTGAADSSPLQGRRIRPVGRPRKQRSQPKGTSR